MEWCGPELVRKLQQTNQHKLVHTHKTSHGFIDFNNRYHRVKFSMGHTGASRKSPNGTPLKVPCQVDSVGQLLHHYWQLLCHRDAELLKWFWGAHISQLTRVSWMVRGKWKSSNLDDLASSNAIGCWNFCSVYKCLSSSVRFIALRASIDIAAEHPSS